MTKPFAFRGQMLLRARQQEEGTARHAMVRVNVQVELIRARIAELHRMQSEQNAAARGALAPGGDRINFEVYRRCATSIQMALKEQYEKLDEATRSLRVRQAELRQAATQCKAVRSLKEKLRDHHHREQERSAVKERDDLFAANVAAINAFRTSEERK